MRAKVSIARFIALRVLLLMAVLMVIYSLTVKLVYQWGTYDNTHYFLSMEADKVFDALNQHEQIPLPSDKYTQYFLNHSALPQKLKTLFPTRLHFEGELLSYEQGSDILYLLPYRHPKTQQFFYIVHTFKSQDDLYEVALDISELLIALGFLTLIIVMLMVKNLAWSIVKPVRSLQQWAVTIRPGGLNRQTLNSPQLKFTELKTVADCLKESIITIENHNEQEKNFLRTLSHELRTPLAITKAALELLEKKPEDLDDGQLKKLARMRRANTNMLSTTESLLWLWSINERTLSKEAVNLSDLVQACVEVNRYLLQRKSVDIALNIPSDLSFHLEKKLLEMLVNNLVRNAFQYTEQGQITITADKHTLVVKNATSHESSFVEESDDYGYGVGLYLVEKLCTQKGWLLALKRDECSFSVSVSLLSH